MRVQAREKGILRDVYKGLTKEVQGCWGNLKGLPQLSLVRGTLRGGGVVSPKASWMGRSSPGEREGRRNVPGRGSGGHVEEQEGIQDDWGIRDKEARAEARGRQQPCTLMRVKPGVGG